jgi:hypothetical protein
MSNSSFQIDQDHLERALKGEGEIWRIIDVSELETIPIAIIHAEIQIIVSVPLNPSLIDLGITRYSIYV